MFCQSTILISNTLGKTLHTRESVNELFSLMKNHDTSNHFEIDFSNVDFISRSFADEFHYQKLKFQNEFQKTVIVLNACDEVYEMLQVVAKNHKRDLLKENTIPVYKYTNKWDLNHFLVSF